MVSIHENGSTHLKAKRLTAEKYITLEVTVTGNNDFDDLRWIALQQQLTATSR